MSAAASGADTSREGMHGNGRGAVPIGSFRNKSSCPHNQRLPDEGRSLWRGSISCSIDGGSGSVGSSSQQQRQQWQPALATLAASVAASGAAASVAAVVAAPRTCRNGAPAIASIGTSAADTTSSSASSGKSSRSCCCS